jgi:hypothetical protein
MEPGPDCTSSHRLAGTNTIPKLRTRRDKGHLSRERCPLVLVNGEFRFSHFQCTVNLTQSLIIVTASVAASTWIGWSIIRARVLPTRFERIAIGDSRQRVLSLLRRPWRIEQCGEPFGNPQGKPDCTEDYLRLSIRSGDSSILVGFV